MMFDKLLKAAIGVALLPVDAAIDMVTLGGALTDEPSQIGKRIDQIGKNVDEALK